MVRSKLISEGSSGCVFMPNIPCKSIQKTTKKNKKTKKTNKKNKTITKLMFADNNKEHDFIKLIKKIKNYKDWTILWEYKCRSAPHKELMKISEIEKCFSNIDKTAKPDKKYTLLQGVYGGITLEKHSNKYITYEVLTNHDKFVKYFIKHFKLLENVFYGLTQLEKHRICHHDINSRNILIKGDESYIIDYDISLSFENISKNKFLKKRMINEMQVECRLYEAYPFEYLYYPLIEDEILTELDAIKYYQPLINYYELYYPIFHELFNINTDKLRSDLLEQNQSGRSDLTGLIKKLDVYSLGMMILIPFFDASVSHMIPHEDIIYLLQTEELEPYLDLIERMISFNHKDRIGAKEAHKIYLILISL